MNFEPDKPCSLCNDVKPTAGFVDKKPVCLKCLKVANNYVKGEGGFLAV